MLLTSGRKPPSSLHDRKPCVFSGGGINTALASHLEQVRPPGEHDQGILYACSLAIKCRISFVRMESFTGFSRHIIFTNIYKVKRLKSWEKETKRRMV
jgi:hypothetical protein